MTKDWWKDSRIKDFLKEWGDHENAEDYICSLLDNTPEGEIEGDIDEYLSMFPDG